MEVSFELKLFINGKEKDKQTFEASGSDGDMIREALIAALKKCEVKFQETLTNKIAKAEKE